MTRKDYELIACVFATTPPAGIAFTEVDRRAASERRRIVRARSNAEAIEAAIDAKGCDNPPRPGPWRRDGRVWYGQCGEFTLTIEKNFPRGMYRWSFIAAHLVTGSADTLAAAKALAIATAIKES